MDRQTETTDKKAALCVIEGFIKSQDSVETDHINQFLHHLIQTFPNIIELFEARLQAKTIVYIRHAQSEYNAWKKKNIINLLSPYKNKPDNYDPSITEQGVNQCKSLLKKFDAENAFQVDLVLVSPLRRAIQTFLNVKDSVVFANRKDIIVSSLLREQMDTAADVGTPLSDLKKEFPDLNFDFLTSEKWWTSSDYTNEQRHENEIVQETRKLVHSRAVLMLLWLSLLDAKTICLVSHANFYRILNKSLKLIGARINNAESKVMDNQTMIKLVKEFLTQ